MILTPRFSFLFMISKREFFSPFSYNSQSLDVQRGAIECSGKNFIKFDGSLSVELLIFLVVVDVFLNKVDELCSERR